MELHNVQQGTQEWHDLRNTHLTASDASAMMGASKYKSRTQLMKEKKFGVKEQITPAKQALFNKGHEAEDSARELLEVDMLESYAPVVCSLEVGGLKLLASLDGLSEDAQTVYEHKLWNETLAENVRNKVLEATHYWQLEHQLLVSGAKVVLFMVSNGTLEKREQMYYSSLPERREQLIAGWKQFKQDLDVFEMEAKQEVVVATQKNLPVITYSVTGTEISTNIGDCLGQIKVMAQKEISKVLKTDQDFADKDQLNKDVKQARSNLKDMVGRVRGEFISYSEFEKIAQDMDSVLQQMQSHGEKQVKEAKEAKKLAIWTEANNELLNHIQDANGQIKPMGITSIMGEIRPDWIGAMKNKRTIESLVNAVSEELAMWKVEINQVMDRVLPNLQFLRDNAAEHRFLFADAQQLVNQGAEPFQAIIKSRIADHQKAEEVRLEADRKRIQQEEKEKAEAKADHDLKIQRLVDYWEGLLEKADEATESTVTSDICGRIAQSDCLDAVDVYDGFFNKIHARHNVVVSIEAEQAKKQQDEHRTAKDARDQRQEDIVDNKLAGQYPVKGTDPSFKGVDTEATEREFITKVFCSDKAIHINLPDTNADFPFDSKDELTKAKELFKQVMRNYKTASKIAEGEGYETNYEQDKILVDFFINA